MSAVLVCGGRVEVPEGWIVVLSGEPQLGDLFLERQKPVVWTDMNIDDVDESDSVRDFDCVIRRDPKETP